MYASFFIYKNYISASTNTYRRTGSKRPVYAPIPGLQNQQFPISQNVGSSGDYFPPPHFGPHKAYTSNKPIGQSLDSSQENSPFLSPVAILPVLVEGLPPNQTIGMPASGDAQIPTMSAGIMGDGRLSPAVAVR